jgi:two-component system sensor histidine kinase HydH
MTVTPPRSARVLVVAEPAEATPAVTALEGAGFRVRTARTAAQALEAARAGFEVALVALSLPDGDGAALGPRLKEQCLDGEIVLLSADESLEAALAAMRAGACAFVVRPAATAELLVTVEQALRQARLHAEKRDLARRAQVAEKLATVGTMTAGLSHEIRNPLNAASLQLQVLERRIQKLEQERQGPLLEPLHLVRDEIRRLSGILEDFLQLARPRELAPGELDLRAVIERVVDFLGGELERRRLTLERDLPASLPPIAGEEGKLRQVIVNLLLNACDATPAGGRVRVSAQMVGGTGDVPGDIGRVALIVEDSGGGIAPAAREQIFEPFFTTKAQGSGLGLSIVHAVVAQHGGSISVGASALGGARFVVELPRWR